MTYNKAEDIASDLVARLGQITVANGYETDIGLRVYRGRIAVVEEDMPCVSMLESNEKITDSAGRYSLVAIDQHYAFVGYLACNPDEPNTAAHKIIRDIKRAIFAHNGTLDGKVKAVKYRGRNIAPRADGAPYVQAIVEIMVHYVEDLTSP